MFAVPTMIPPWVDFYDNSEPVDFENVAIQLCYGTDKEKRVPGGNATFASLFSWYPISVTTKPVTWFSPSPTVLCQYPWLIFFRKVPEMRLCEFYCDASHPTGKGTGARISDLKRTRGPPLPFMLAFAFQEHGTPFAAAHTRHARLSPAGIAAVNKKFGDAYRSAYRFFVRRGENSVEGLLAKLALTMAVRGELDDSKAATLLAAVEDSDATHFIRERTGKKQSDNKNAKNKSLYSHDRCVASGAGVMYDYDSSGALVAGNPNVELALLVFLHSRNLAGANFDLCRLVHYHIPDYIGAFERAVSDKNAPQATDRALVEAFASAILGRRGYNELRLDEAVVNRITKPHVAPADDRARLDTRQNFVRFFLYENEKGRVMADVFGRHVTVPTVEIFHLNDHYGFQQLPGVRVPVRHVCNAYPASALSSSSGRENHALLHADTPAQLKDNETALGPWFASLVYRTFLKLIGAVRPSFNVLNRYAVVSRFLTQVRGEKSAAFVRSFGGDAQFFFHYYDDELMRAYIDDSLVSAGVTGAFAAVPRRPHADRDGAGVKKWFADVLEAMASGNETELEYLTCTDVGDPFNVWASQTRPPKRLDKGDKYRWSVFNNVIRSGLTPEYLRSNSVDPYYVLGVPKLS